MPVLLQNARSTELPFDLEPWGERYVMAAEAAFEIVAEGPAGHFLEVVVTDEGITIYGWSGSVVSLYHDGAELGAGRWKRSPVPPTPRGEER